ncbi:uncharacterized protein LOC142640335 [Castanea sativa]|uniref:uncharacterized protein LOC142640335 n=1 Tax=Castanea sativa TaxID=21020 RepID=UPI003F64B794
MGKWDLISSASKSVIQNAPDLTTVKGWCLGSYGYGWAAVAKVDDVVRTKVIQSMQDEEARSEIGRIATNFAESAAVLACKEGLKTIPGQSLQLRILSHVVRTKVIQSMQDEEARSEIGRIATDFAKSAAVLAREEGLKTITGLSLQLHTLSHVVRMKVIQSMQDEEARSEIGRIATNFAKGTALLACEEGLKTIPGGMLLYKIVLQSLYNEKKYGGNEVETKALQAKISKMEEEITECKKLIEREKLHKPFADFKLEKISSSFESNVDEKPEDVIGDFMNF